METRRQRGPDAVCTCGCKTHMVNSCHPNAPDNTSEPALLTLARDRRFTDIVICLSDGTEIEAHSQILANWSCVFQKMLFSSSTCGEKINGIIKLPDIDPSVARKFIDMVYYIPNIPIGKISADDANSIIPIAYRYDVPLILKACASVIKREVLCAINKQRSASSDRRPVKPKQNQEIELSEAESFATLTNSLSTFCDQTMSSQELIDIISDIVNTITEYMSMKPLEVLLHYATFLSYRSVVIVISSDTLEINEIWILKMIICWLSRTRDRSEHTANGSIPEEELDVIKLVRFGLISMEDWQTFYNEYIHRIEGRKIPFQVSTKLNALFLDAIMVNPATSVNQKALNKSMYECSTNSKKRGGSNPNHISDIQISLQPSADVKRQRTISEKKLGDFF